LEWADVRGKGSPISKGPPLRGGGKTAPVKECKRWGERKRSRGGGGAEKNQGNQNLKLHLLWRQFSIAEWENCSGPKKKGGGRMKNEVQKGTTARSSCHWTKEKKTCQTGRSGGKDQESKRKSRNKNHKKRVAGEDLNPPGEWAPNSLRVCHRGGKKLFRGGALKARKKQKETSIWGELDSAVVRQLFFRKS